MSMAMTDCVLTKNEMPVFRPFPLESPFSGLTSGINNQKKKKRERGMVGWQKLPSTKRKKNEKQSLVLAQSGPHCHKRNTMARHSLWAYCYIKVALKSNLD